MTLGSIQSLTEISTRNTSWVQRWPVTRAENLTTFRVPIIYKSESLNLLELCQPASGL